MWPFKKKPRGRRTDPRRGAPPGEVSLWLRFSRAGGVGSVVLAAGFYLVVLLMAIWPLDAIGYRAGQYLPNDITARCDFKVLSEKKLAKAMQNVRNAAHAVFRVNIALVDEIRTMLNSLPKRLGATTQPAKLDEDLRKLFALHSDETLSAWRKYADPNSEKELARQVAALRTQLLQTYLVVSSEKKTSARYVDLVVGDQATASDWSELVSLGNESRVAEKVSLAVARAMTDEALRESVKTYLLHTFLGGRALYGYDAEATDKAIGAATAAIGRTPPAECYDHHRTGIILVGRSRRQRAHRTEVVALGEEELNLLKAEHRAFLRTDRKSAPWARWTRAGGRGVVLLVITLLLVGYVAHYAPQIVQDHWRALAIGAVMLLMLAIAKVMTHFGTNPYAAALPLLMAVLVIAIARDQRFALGTGGILAAYIVFQMRADLVMLFVLMVAVAASVVQLREIRTRTMLVRVSAIAACAVFACTWAQALAWSVPWRFALADSLWGSGAALLAGFLIQGILPLIERVFGIATNMTLLDWCDASRPLLQRLETEARGTYNHSRQLGTICEAAAEAIGARPLLARVGAYYHDIGKMYKPDYFIENQDGSTSKHEKLSPAMSLLIVTGHVKDGLELARRYGLPRILYEFIATHHGTTLVQYFYKAATERRKVDTERAPDEVEFRYPGPKPHMPEAAILMLGDAAESSVRAMPEPLPGRIENQVHTMVQRRLTDGQLDECDLTLNQVHQVETSLTKSLCAIYHPRVVYPTPDGERPAAAELPNGKPPSPSPRNGKADRPLAP